MTGGKTCPYCGARSVHYPGCPNLPRNTGPADNRARLNRLRAEEAIEKPEKYGHKRKRKSYRG